MKKKLLLPAAFLLTLLLGVGMGAATDSAPADTAAPQPTPTQTVQTPGPTVTVKPPPVVVYRTPDECIAALDAADQVMGVSAKAFDAAAAGFEAAAALDIEALMTANDRMTALKPDMDAAITEYRTQKDACRASGNKA